MRQTVGIDAVLYLIILGLLQIVDCSVECNEYEYHSMPMAMEYI